MKSFTTKLLGAILWLTSRLPFRVLYILSDITYFLIYYVARYRKKIVRRNITDSFPGKSNDEIKEIVKDFYRNFSDYIFETIKYASISEKKIMKRIRFENVGLIRRYLDDGQPIVCYFSHCGNWEWVTSMGVFFRDKPNQRLGEVYRPLKNKWVNDYLLKVRTRFNTICLPKATVFRDMVRLKAQGYNLCIGFMSDQKPSHGDRVHIIPFLNHPTAVITGTETVARKLNAAVVYFDMTKTMRGHYHLRIVPMADSAALTADFELTDLYFRLLEANIKRDPSIWLWSHNRWKYPVMFPDKTPEP